MSDERRSGSTSGGGIVFGGIGSDGGGGSDDLARGLRRRWATGVAVVTTMAADGGLRGVTVSSLMHVALEPPTLAIALAAESSFQTLLPVGAEFAVSILDRAQEFMAERFAGRAPVPDATFGGIPCDLLEGRLPILRGALAWCRCTVETRQDAGDHVMLVGAVREGALAPDSDDPLLRYEGYYRGLEVR